MGSVYVAMDRRLDREVALKIMRPDLARDDAFVARFRREAKSAARLTDPHVVAVTDQGQDDKYAFLAMELVRGGTLRSVIREEAPLPPGQALDIAESILQALAAAHRAGIVHRDVKPENVLIGEDGTVKVADFGLARAVTTETMTGDSDILLGTAAYLSPEQVERGTADERSDVYSAALILFEMLTGSKAFPGDSPIHVAYQHVHGDMPVASDLVPTVPADLDELIALGARKDPGERPRNAAVYLQALRATRRRLSEDDLAVVPASATSADDRREGHDEQVRFADGAFEDHTRAISTDGTDPLDVTGAPAPARGRRRRRGLVIGLVVVVALAIGGGWLFTAGPLGRTTVPSVKGHAQGAAVDTLRAAELSVKLQQDFSEHVRKGTVISVAPAAGSTVRKHESVVLHVSKGPERYDVPRLVGTTRHHAVQALKRAHLAPGTTTRRYSAKVAAGRVIASSPSAGTASRKGTKVDLVVSKGRQPVDVPDVAGHSRHDAKTTLTGLGLTVKFGPERHDRNVAKGDVISQSPGPGTAHKGDTVTLVVSKGPRMVAVPDVIGMTTEQATSTLEDAGLKVKVNRYFGGIFDKVRAQSIGKGKQVAVGTTVTISVV